MPKFRVTLERVVVETRDFVVKGRNETEVRANAREAHGYEGAEGWTRGEQLKTFYPQVRHIAQIVDGQDKS